MGNGMDSPLFRAGVMTFEELGFLLPELAEDEQQEASIDGIAAQVCFSGPLEGRLLVKMSGELLAVMTVNMLGEEGIPSMQQQHDALGEVANVICGNALPLIAGAKEVFRIGAPEILENGDSAKAETGATVSHVLLNFGDGLAELKLFVDRETQSRPVP